MTVVSTESCTPAPSAEQCLIAAKGLNKIGFIAWHECRDEVHISTGARALLRLSTAQAMQASDLLALIAPTSLKQYCQAWRKAVADRDRCVSGALEVCLAGTEPRHFNVCAVLDYSESGQLEGGVLALHDITDQSATLHALTESEARLEEAQHIAKFAYWEWDYDKRCGVFSPACLKMLHLPPDWKPNHKALVELVPPDQRDWVLGLYQEAVANKVGTLRYEVKHPRPDGSTQEIHTVAKLDYTEDGRLRRLMATIQDITELKSYRRKLHSLSFFDPITELPNRALFADRLTQALSDASWHNHQVGLIMADLDRFKGINDTLGHGAGDSLLRQAAQRLKQTLREYDTVARLGGDEFAVVLPEVRQATDMGSIAQKVLGAFEKPFVLDGNEVFITVSVGGAMYPQDAKDVDQLMQFADAALYFAKTKGRNNFQFYSRELTAQASERLAIEGDLRKGLQNNELELHYQPKYDLQNGQLVGAEALMRWNHPQRGMVPPLSFISVAEDTGLIVPMGQWALQTACEAAVRWNAGRVTPLKIAVNLSVRQFGAGNFADTVREALRDTHCDPRWIELEITESLLLDGHQAVLSVLQDIASQGISIAIDDFGTGYSALSYLTRFPVQVLKIDRAFIKDMGTERSSTELVKAIVSLGHSLNMKLVAEGVETPEQAQRLTQLGCELVQGFLFGRPMPEAAFSALIAQADAAQAGVKQGA